MGSVGDPNQLIVNSQWILKQGTDEYILKNSITLDVGRPKFRDAIDIGPVNTFGAGEHSVVCTFEADITKSVNWVNLNARDQVTGFLPNLPYTLTMRSKDVTPSGTNPSVTVTVSDGKIDTTTIVSPGSNLTSVILSLSGGGTPTRLGKLIGIVSEGQLVKVIISDQGEGQSSAPTVTEDEVETPVAFAFNAEVSDVSLSPSDNEGRVKIDATLTITDDAVEPTDG